MTCFQTLCWHVALKTLSETSLYFSRYPRCCGGWVSNLGPPTACFWHYCCLTADMSLLLTIDTQIKMLIRNGWKLRKIKFPRLRTAMLRIRPGEEDVGQIQPWALGTVLGRGEVPGLCRTWLSRAPACGSWGPALLQTLLGQGLTELGEGSEWGPGPPLAPGTVRVGSALKVWTASYLNTKRWVILTLVFAVRQHDAHKHHWHPLYKNCWL